MYSSIFITEAKLDSCVEESECKRLEVNGGRHLNMPSSEISVVQMVISTSAVEQTWIDNLESIASHYNGQ